MAATIAPRSLLSSAISRARAARGSRSSPLAPIPSRPSSKSSGPPLRLAGGASSGAIPSSRDYLRGRTPQEVSGKAARIETAHNKARLRELYAGQRVEEAFSNFSLLERQADLAEGHAEALMLAAPARSLEDEIAELKVNEKVEAELAAMKAARREAA